MAAFVVGIDVGTGSVRAGLFSERGELKQLVSRSITVNNPTAGFYQQSSDEIWTAVCENIRELVTDNSEVDVVSVSFCGTCSLVAIGKDNEPISVCKTGNPKWNVVMWMDHRAFKEADEINALNHPILSMVGGRVSPEMQIPKIMWLKKNLPSSYTSTKHYFDLSDYLRWKATSSLKRSICSLVCKWNFLYEQDGKCEWDDTFFRQLDFTKHDCLEKFGNDISFPGDFDTISKQATLDLNLKPAAKVGFSMIDAYSGLLGMMAGRNIASVSDATSSLVLICGTSNCVMAVSEKPIGVSGIWGPYYGVVLDQLYVSEGGQSASGKLIDHIVSSHPAYMSLLAACGSHDSVLLKLEETLVCLSEDSKSVTELTQNLHVFPDFHGNRSPIADSTLKGMITGLTLSTNENDLALLYLATLQALSYGIRHIKDALESSGHNFRLIQVCGGLAKSEQFLQSLRDVMDLEIDSSSVEPIVLGAAISALAAYKAERSDSDQKNCALGQTLLEMTGKRISSSCFQRKDERLARYHDGKYKVFLELLKDQNKYRKIMADSINRD